MVKKIILNGRSITYDLQIKSVKNINLRIRADGSVSVSANRLVPIEDIERFMRDKSEFILSALERYEKRRENMPKPSNLEDGDTVRILGRDRPIRLVEGKQNKVEFTDGTRSLILCVRDTDDVELKRRTVDKWQKELCAEVIEELCRRVYPIFEKKGIPFPELHFHKMKTRWGSCNPSGHSLNFNVSLINKPVTCIEYVVMHEFVHFLHPDHSREFYNELSSLMPDWKERKRILES